MIRFFSALFIFLSTVVVGFVGCLFVAFQYYNHDLPDYQQLTSYQPPVVTRLYANDGTLFSEFASENRVFIPIENIPPLVKQAFLAAEDKNFYQHNGIDVLGIFRAALSNFSHLGSGKRPVGASTITQQVAKNFLLSNELSLGRKIKEAILAYRIEETLSKDRILELYLNEIYLGASCYGVGSAALHYFNKSLDELKVEEVTYLAALPKAPSNYDPHKALEKATIRRNWVITRMVEDEFISSSQAMEALQTPLTVSPKDPKKIVVGSEFYGEEVRRFLKTRYGDDALYKGGLVVKTSLDPQMQSIAMDSLQQGIIEYDERHGFRGPIARMNIADFVNWQVQFQKIQKPVGLGKWRLALVLQVNNDKVSIGFQDGTQGEILLPDLQWARKWIHDDALGPRIKKCSEVLNQGDVVAVHPSDKGSTYRLHQIPKVSGAMVAMDPQTGRVLAMVGGYSYDMSEFNRATQALRQAGSVFKPFIYLAAFEKGYTPETIVEDAPFSINMGHGLGVYSPKNIDNKFLGPIPLSTALAKSRNLVTIRLAYQMVGMKNVSDIAQRFGIMDHMPKQLAMALGAGETTLMNLTAAYGMIANGGKHITPSIIDQVQNRHGLILLKSDHRQCPNCSHLDWQNQSIPLLKDDRQRVSDPKSIYYLTTILEGVVQNGTAKKALTLNRPIAGKTGTTNDSNDTWFIGFTPNLVVGVFVGFDIRRTLGKKEVGSKVALPIFIKFMERALKDTPPIPFRAPADELLKSAHAPNAESEDEVTNENITELSDQDLSTLKEYSSDEETSQDPSPEESTEGVY